MVIKYISIDPPHFVGPNIFNKIKMQRTYSLKTKPRLNFVLSKSKFNDIPQMIEPHLHI